MVIVVIMEKDLILHLQLTVRLLQLAIIMHIIVPLYRCTM